MFKVIQLIIILIPFLFLTGCFEDDEEEEDNNESTAARLGISENDSYSFATLRVGGISEHVFILVNAGEEKALAINASAFTGDFDFKGGSFPGTGGNCSATLEVQSSCDIVVEFSPTSAGVHDSVLSISYDSGEGSKIVARTITGTGTNDAILSISEAPQYDYGDVSTGSAPRHTFTVSNMGNTGAVSMSGLTTAPFSFRGGSYPGAGANCGTSLASLTSCQISIVFSPVTVGLFLEEIVIDYDNGTEMKSALRDVLGSGI